MLAVVGGHVDAVSLLLEREASVNVTNKHGFTALHHGVTLSLLARLRMLHHFQVANKMKLTDIKVQNSLSTPFLLPKGILIKNLSPIAIVVI